MGASVSTNTSSILTSATNKVVNDVTQESNIENNQKTTMNIDAKGNITLNNLVIKQNSSSHYQNVFSNLSNEENKEKFKEEIAQAAKALISGLNLANVSVSVNDVNNVIKNCIDIVNKNASRCGTKVSENIDINLKSDLDVTLNNVEINQQINMFVSCLLSSNNVTSTINETNALIKEMSSSKTEGFDLKWLFIAAALGVGGVSIAGSKALSTMLGPGMILAGAGLTYYSISSQNNQKTRYVNDYVYVPNDLFESVGNLQPIKTVKISNIPADPTTLGEADVYEFYNDSATLYKILNNLKIKDALKNLNKAPFKTNDFNFGIVNDKKLILNVKNTKRYTSIELLQAENPIKYHVLSKNEEPDKNDNDTIQLDISDINYSHSINMYRQGKNFQTYYLKPTIVSYKTEEVEESTEYYKKPMFLLGIGLIAVGILMTFMSHSKGGRKDR